MTALPSPGFDPKPWLRVAGRASGRTGRTAGLLVVLDVVPATAFAFGLAWSLSAYDRGLTAVVPGLALALAALALRGLLAHLALTTGGHAARAVKTQVRDRVLAGLFAGRPAAVSAAVEGVEALDGHYARFEPVRMAAGLSPLILICVAAVASPFAAGVLIFTLLPFVLGMVLAGTAAAAESRRQFDALSRLSGLFLDRVRALPAVIAFQAEARMAQEVARTSQALQARTARVLRIAFVSSAVLEFFSALAVALVAVYCGFNLLKLLPFPAPETLDLGRAFFVLALAPEVYAPLRRLAAAYHDRQAAEAAAPTLAAAEADPAPARPAPVFARPPVIVFDRVGIRYGQDAPVLDGFELEVRSGQMVAVTGPSGSGKSSLLHALVGLAPVTDGHILVDGRALDQIGDLAGRVAWASQAPVVTPGTLLDNIRLARREASLRQVMAAAGAAGLTGDLDRVLDERGGGLSGGERRRLGLARAFLKDSPILLLDEPTANLDRQAEIEMIEVVRRAAHGRTTLIATHSAAVAAVADRVVRL